MAGPGNAAAWGLLAAARLHRVQLPSAGIQRHRGCPSISAAVAKGPGLSALGMDMGTRATPDCHVPSVLLTLIPEEKETARLDGERSFLS